MCLITNARSILAMKLIRANPPNPPATSLTSRIYPLHEVNELTRQTNPPPPAPYTNVRNFGNFSRLREKRRTIKIGFYFFTYECCRRRLSSVSPNLPKSRCTSRLNTDTTATSQVKRQLFAENDDLKSVSISLLMSVAEGDFR